MAGTILNNNAVSPENLLRVTNPYEYFADPESPKALAGGEVYFGLPTYDPLQPENRKAVYIAQEDGGSVRIDQPVKLGNGGVPMYNGSPAVILIDGPYSMRVLDKNGASKYYTANVNHLSSIDVGIAPKEEILTVSGSPSALTFDNLDVSVAAFDMIGDNVDNGPLYRDIDYAVADGGAGVITLINPIPDGTLVRGRQHSPDSGRNLRKELGLNRYTFKNLAEAKAADLDVDDVVELLDFENDGDENGALRYLVVPNETGINDGLNFINTDNGLQLMQYRFRQKLKSFSETVLVMNLDGPIIYLDASKASFFSVTLDRNVTDVRIINENQSAITTATVKIRQGTAGNYSVSFPATDFGGNGQPTMTQGVGKEDIYVISKLGNGRQFGAIFGQGFN